MRIYAYAYKPSLAYGLNKRTEKPETMNVEKFKTSLKKKHSGLSVGVVIAFVVIALVLAIGIYVVAYFQVSLNTSGLKNTATNAIGSVFNTAYTGFQLLVVGLIVLAAVAILSILTGGFMTGNKGGMV
jgi:hypothetical protein